MVRIWSDPNNSQPRTQQLHPMFEIVQDDDDDEPNQRPEQGTILYGYAIVTEEQLRTLARESQLQADQNNVAEEEYRRRSPSPRPTESFHRGFMIQADLERHEQENRRRSRWRQFCLIQ